MNCLLCVLSALLLLCAFASGSPQPFGHVTPRNVAPQFSATAVINEKFEKISLSNYLSRGKWVVLLFYPFDFTFVCPTEIISFSDHSKDFAAQNTEVLGISTDSQFTHLAWIHTPRKEGGLGKIGIPLVADVSKTISRSYGVLVEDENDGMFGAALRGLFIIDPKGKIRSMTINDEQVGRSVEETLRLIQGFQYADANGLACPAQWRRPGDATIIPNPEDSKEYFRSAAFAEKEL
jgi:peroxiredoxin (alkyl hydroperoxide reductase subunit C)